MVRGRKPLPTRLKILRGVHKVNPERINRNEPQPKEATPAMPSGLDAMAKRRWRELSDVLASMRVLTVADRHALGTLCQTMSDIHKLRKVLASEGHVIDTERGPMRNPAAVELHKLEDVQLKLLAEFGLTPSSRSRITVEPQKSAIKPRERKKA